MRMTIFACGTLLVLTAVSAVAATHQPVNIETPGEGALLVTPTGTVLPANPSNLPLYYFDDDEPGKSNCNMGCELKWQPLPVTETSKAVGDWKILTRYDGHKQWSYKGRPVYVLFHDSADRPMGDGADGKWHFIKP